MTEPLFTVNQLIQKAIDRRFLFVLETYSKRITVKKNSGEGRKGRGRRKETEKGRMIEEGKEEEEVDEEEGEAMYYKHRLE